MSAESGPGSSLTVTAEPQGLARLITELRMIYQADLVKRARLRQQLDADLKSTVVRISDASEDFRPDIAALARYTEAWRAHGGVAASSNAAVHPRDLEEARRRWTSSVERVEHALAEFKTVRDAWDGDRKRVFARRRPEPHLDDDFARRLQDMTAVVDAYPSLREGFISEQTALARQELRDTFEAESAAMDADLTTRLAENLASARMAIELLGADGFAWERWLSDPPIADLPLRGLTRLGDLQSGLPSPYDVTAPCVIGFPAGRALAIQAATDERSAALDLMGSVVLRVLLTLPPGHLQMTFIDPTGLGQSFAEFLHLADFDERLVDSAVKTSADAIERCLSEHVSHLQTIISKYLRAQFGTVADYNRHAGEMAEPYRLIVIADFPTQFSERAREHLLSLVENGPRCGVYVLLMCSTSAEPPDTSTTGRLLRALDVVTVSRQGASIQTADSSIGLEFVPDACPAIAFGVDGSPATPAAALVERLGRSAKAHADAPVTLESFLPALSSNRVGPAPEFAAGAETLSMDSSTWWSASTAESAVAPVGRSGARGVASAFFSSTAVAGGLIMVGLPRSGKTTALHSMITTMSMLYSPDEMELYLIDAKHGVEFKAYENLPHARMVSVRSEREFSVAVLKSIQAKIRERADLIKTHGAGLSNLTEYRAATGAQLPRIIVVIDEFHELFEEPDALGLEAFSAFSDIVRMGPFAGVHMVVASQTLSSMPAMDRQTLTLLPQRIAFMCNEYDSEVVMGDSNKATRLLSKTGEGIFNPARGDESRNQPFQGLYMPPGMRRRILADMRELADERGWTRKPRVFDGDAVVARPTSRSEAPAPRRLALALGEPFTLAETERIQISRSRGGNVLLIGDQPLDGGGDLAIRGAMHSILLESAEHEALVSVVDLVGDDDLSDGLPVDEIARSVGAHYQRSTGLASTLRAYAKTVAARTISGDYAAPTRILILRGVQRARGLVPQDPYSSQEDEDMPTPATDLRAILVGGPEVGVHTILTADHSRAVENRLGQDLLDEFGIRIAGSAADHADMSLIGTSYGTPSVVRPGQLLLADALRGTERRVRGYDIVREISELNGRNESVR